MFNYSCSCSYIRSPVKGYDMRFFPLFSGIHDDPLKKRTNLPTSKHEISVNETRIIVKTLENS